MTEQDYINAFMEGASLAPKDDVIYFLLSKSYWLQDQVRNLKDAIEVMDDIARDNNITLKCRSCGKRYEIPCELSEVDPDYNYCNGSHFCTP